MLSRGWRHFALSQLVELSCSNCAAQSHFNPSGEVQLHWPSSSTSPSILRSSIAKHLECGARSARHFVNCGLASNGNVDLRRRVLGGTQLAAFAANCVQARKGADNYLCLLREGRISRHRAL